MINVRTTTNIYKIVWIILKSFYSSIESSAMERIKLNFASSCLTDLCHRQTLHDFDLKTEIDRVET